MVRSTIVAEACGEIRCEADFWTEEGERAWRLLPEGTVGDLVELLLSSSFLVYIVLTFGAVQRAFGYKQVLHRTWGQAENICASFCALYFVGGIRYVYFVGISAGGPPAVWSSWLVTIVCACITAAMLAEVCSSIPLSGSIYIWAAECAGSRWGRLAGFIVAFWSTTAWTSFIASICQGTMYYVMSELTVFGKTIDGGLVDTNIKFRALVWIGAEILLWSAVAINFINPKAFRWVFFITAGVMLTDWLLTLIWLPIGVSKTYGFQDASFFTEYYNGTGAPTGWNWLLSFLFTSGVLTGFDAAGHVAEETKNASVTAARGIFWSCFISAVLGTPIIFLYLVCSPDIDVMFSLDAPQPFVVLYSLALGKGGQLVMVVIAVLGLWLNTVVCIIAASRLVFAIARDGVLPGSSWIGKVQENGQPKNAVLFTGAVAAVLLCTILPSPVAFTSLVSAGAMPTIAAYALIPALRLFVTPGKLKMAKWSNGRFSKPFCWIAMFWNLFILTTVISPYYFPVTADTFNYAPVIFGAVTLMAIAAYFIVPEEKWLPQRKIIEIQENEGWERNGNNAVPASTKID